MPMSLRSLTHIDASVAVLSASTTVFPLASQSFARCEFSLSVLNFATFSLPMAFRNMACVSTSLAVFICARFGASLCAQLCEVGIVSVCFWCVTSRCDPECFGCHMFGFFAVSIWRHEIWLLLVPSRHVDSGIVAVSEVVCTSGCFSGGAWRHAPGRVLVCSKFFAFRQLTFRMERFALWLVSGSA